MNTNGYARERGSRLDIGQIGSRNLHKSVYNFVGFMFFLMSSFTAFPKTVLLVAV